MTLDSRCLAALLPLLLAGAPLSGCGDDDPKSSSTDAASSPVGEGDGGGLADGGPRDAGASTGIDAASGPDGSSPPSLGRDAGGASDGGVTVQTDGAANEADATTTDGSTSEADAALTPGEPDGAVADVDAQVGATPDAGDSDGGAQVFTQDEVVGFVQAANVHEITAGQRALERATDEAVRAYAADMIAMHTPAKDTLADFAVAQGIAEGSNREEDLFRERQLQIERDLAAVPSAGFDLLYINSQVDAHTELLSMLDTVLIPSASAALREQLVAMRPMIADHLLRALDLKATLSAR